MFAGAKMWAKGALSGFEAGVTKGFSRSASGARGYMAGYKFAKFGTTSTGRGMSIGMVSGGIYGGISDDTSVLGGMAGGALLGAGIARYGGAALKGSSLRSGARAAGRRVMGDIGRAGGAGVRRSRAFKSIMENLRGSGGSKVHAAKASTQASASGATIANSVSKAVNPIPSSMTPPVAIPTVAPITPPVAIPTVAPITAPVAENATLAAAKRFVGQQFGVSRKNFLANRIPGANKAAGWESPLYRGTMGAMRRARKRGIGY